jgi:hypothetical protein
MPRQVALQTILTRSTAGGNACPDRQESLVDWHVARYLLDINAYDHRNMCNCLLIEQALTASATNTEESWKVVVDKLAQGH